MTKVFENHHLITEITEKVEERWEADIPSKPSRRSPRSWHVFLLIAWHGGRGFVHIPGAQSDKQDGDVYVVSVFHQLHCLGMMREHPGISATSILMRDKLTARHGNST